MNVDIQEVGDRKVDIQEVDSQMTEDRQEVPQTEKVDNKEVNETVVDIQEVDCQKRENIQETQQMEDSQEVNQNTVYGLKVGH